MKSVKRNIAANFVGNIWQAFMALAFIPLYIKFMGIESYGLIGVFASLQALFIVLDFGLGATLSRELARLSVLPDKSQEMLDLCRSLEIIYWSIAVLIGLIVVAFAPLIAYHWVKPGQLSPKTIEQAIMIMGFAMALQWPSSLYSSGLVGLQRQVLLNIIKIAIGTFRGIGVVFVLWLVSPTISVFFTFQIIVSAINVFLVAFFLWNSLPHTKYRAVFKKRLLIGVWRFAAGMSGISILATILTQLDKVILSKMLTLEMFGYYALAGAVASTIYRLVGPVFSAVYPRFVQLVSLTNQQALKQLYHKSCQLMSVLILPLAVIVAMFSYELLFIWTQNQVTAQKTHLLVSILVCGTALNGLMNVPGGLQLAYGWTSLGLYTNLISVIILAPLIIFLTHYYGAIGGATSWVILNVGYIFLVIQILHRRLLPTEKWHWYWNDTGIPFIAAILVAGTGRLLVGSKSMPQPIMVLFLIVISLSTFIAVALVTPMTRGWIRVQLAKLNLC